MSCEARIAGRRGTPGCLRWQAGRTRSKKRSRLTTEAPRSSRTSPQSPGGSELRNLRRSALPAARRLRAHPNLLCIFMPSTCTCYAYQLALNSLPMRIAKPLLLDLHAHRAGRSASTRGSASPAASASSWSPWCRSSASPWAPSWPTIRREKREEEASASAAELAAVESSRRGRVEVKILIAVAPDHRRRRASARRSTPCRAGRRTPARVVKSLTVRISVSVALFIALMVAWKLGIIEPQGQR